MKNRPILMNGPDENIIIAVKAGSSRTGHPKTGTVKHLVYFENVEYGCGPALCGEMPRIGWLKSQGTHDEICKKCLGDKIQED